MPFYENVFIVRQDLSVSQVESLTETFIALIRDQGGEVTKVEPWGLRHFVYKIQKQRRGYYILMNIDAPIPAVQELERSMRLNEDVLRFLIVRVDALDPNPSPMMLANERAERNQQFEVETSFDDATHYPIQDDAT